MAGDLYTYRYGPTAPTQVLALHGLGGHGQRWRTLSAQYLPEFTVAAPDLLGHGRSSWSAPWSIDANVAALAALVRDDGDGPVLVVGHSFGGAIALHLAAAHPDLVSGLVLLDPAIGLNGERMREVAEAAANSPDYADREEVRTEKLTGSWADVPEAELDDDLDEHLIELPSGRYGWRVFPPAMMSYWSELARDIVLPHKGIPTTVVRATKTVPPYVGARLLDGLSDRLGSDFTLIDLDCRHMVPHAKPDETADIIRNMLTRG